MSDFIALSIPNFSGNELKYVTEAVETQWVSTGGKMIEKLENNLASYLNVKKVTALQSGTAGLHLAMILSNIKENDEVIVPSLTFIAAVNPIKYVGANPVFMDCDDFLCLDVNKVKEFFENECTFKNGKLINNKTKRQIKAIVAVHIFGNMVDMNALMSLSKQYNLKVIEDATEALGTFNKKLNKFAGTIGDFGVYSFNGNKIITTGGGGALTALETNDVDRAKYLSTQAKRDLVYFIHDEIGYNYRMTNLQAALGLAQFEQLEKFIEIKKKNYDFYLSEGLNLLKFNKNERSNYWFYSLFTNKRDDLIKYLTENKIQSRPIWKLIHTLEPYKNSQSYKIEKAFRYYEEIVNIPCSTNLTKENLLKVVSVIKNFENK